MCKLFLHATNILQGGGRSLLVALLNKLTGTTKIILVHDGKGWY